MTTRELLTTHGRRIAWALFAVECLALFGWAVRLAVATPQPTVDGAITGAARVRFGKTEVERRRIFQDLVTGENGDRTRANAESESAVWNRNRDDFFHQFEAGRVAGAAGRARIPLWQAWLIIDEGFRGHWPPPPGVEIRYDDPPLSRTTRPIAQHPILVSTPAKPAAPPPPAAYGPEWPPPKK